LPPRIDARVRDRLHGHGDHGPVSDTLRRALDHDAALVLRASEVNARVCDALPTVADLGISASDRRAGVGDAGAFDADLTALAAHGLAARRLTDAVEAGRRRGTAQLSAREDARAVATEARAATVDAGTGVRLAARGAAALTKGAARVNAVGRPAAAASADFALAAGHALTRVSAAAVRAGEAAEAAVNRTPRHAHAIGAEGVARAARLAARRQAAAI